MMAEKKPIGPMCKNSMCAPCCPTVVKSEVIVTDLLSHGSLANPHQCAFFELSINYQAKESLTPLLATLFRFFFCRWLAHLPNILIVPAPVPVCPCMCFFFIRGLTF